MDCLIAQLVHSGTEKSVAYPRNYFGIFIFHEGEGINLWDYLKVGNCPENINLSTGQLSFFYVIQAFREEMIHQIQVLV